MRAYCPDCCAKTIRHFLAIPATKIKIFTPKLSYYFKRSMKRIRVLKCIWHHIDWIQQHFELPRHGQCRALAKQRFDFQNGKLVQHATIGTIRQRSRRSDSVVHRKRGRLQVGSGKFVARLVGKTNATIGERALNKMKWVQSKQRVAGDCTVRLKCTGKPKLCAVAERRRASNETPEWSMSTQKPKLLKQNSCLGVRVAQRQPIFHLKNTTKSF